MTSGYSTPAYRDFLTCLLPDPSGTATLCQLLEDSFFGAHVTGEDNSNSDVSGFPDSASDSDGGGESSPDPFETTQSSEFAPSRFVWRNSVGHMMSFSRDLHTLTTLL